MYKFAEEFPDNLELQRPKIELHSKNKVKFKNRFTKITKVLNSPLYSFFSLWDHLPIDLQHVPDLKTFNPFTAVSHPGGFRGGFRVTLLGFMQ